MRQERDTNHTMDRSRPSAAERWERLRRHYRDHTPEHVWEQIELELGPLDQLDKAYGPTLADAHLKSAVRAAAFVARVRSEPLTVPAVVAEKVLTSVVNNCRVNASTSNRRMLTEAKQLLRMLRAHIRAQNPRPRHRPKKNWFLKRAERIAVGELKRRCRELMYAEGLSRGDAIDQAAEEIAPGYDISPGTLISWYANPARRRRK